MTFECAQAVATALHRAIVPRVHVQASASASDSDTYEVFVMLPQRTPAGHLERALRVARVMNCEVWLEREPLGLRLTDRTLRTAPLVGITLSPCACADLDRSAQLVARRLTDALSR